MSNEELLRGIKAVVLYRGLIYLTPANENDSQ